jgi:hypothetical protein
VGSEMNIILTAKEIKPITGAGGLTNFWRFLWILN